MQACQVTDIIGILLADKAWSACDPTITHLVYIPSIPKLAANFHDSHEDGDCYSRF